jgi:hypothetical protein
VRSQHVDGDWLHGFVSWPGGSIAQVGARTCGYCSACIGADSAGAVSPSKYLRVGFDRLTTKRSAARSCHEDGRKLLRRDSIETEGNLKQNTV